MYIKQEVEPIQFVYPVRVIHSIEIQVVNLILFQSASVMVSLYDENDSIIENKMVNITGSDYLNWGSNDNWLVEYVLTQLNLQKKLNLGESQNTNI